MKEKNQWRGKLFEYLICCIHNKEAPKNIYSTFIDSQEYKKILRDAEEINKDLPFPDKKYKWIGEKTIIQNGDIICEGKTIEIKYVSCGNGTYLNTSLSNIEKYGIPDYRSFLQKNGVYDFLSNFTQVNYQNHSPVSMEQSSFFRYYYSEDYKKLQTIEKEARKEYLSKIEESFKQSPQNVIHFYADCLSKNIGRKEVPDYIYVYNYKKKETHLLSLPGEKVLKLKFTEKGFSINSTRFAIGWQNGCGLNNPTIRVFLG